MPVVRRERKKPATLPDSETDCREELELLRGQRERREISSDQFVTASARLVRRIDTLMAKRRRFALT